MSETQLSPFLPDYNGGSIANLMASIAAACGVKDAPPYPALASLPPHRLSKAKNIVLVVIDGLGMDTLQRLGPGGHLHRHLAGGLTSVFPSTTATAATCLLTGQTAQQHGLTGWHMFFREIGCILAVLPLFPRHGGPRLRECGVDPDLLLRAHPLFPRLSRPGHVVSPKFIINSDFNLLHSAGAERHAYEGVAEFFASIRDVVKTGRGRQYLHAYYPTLDSLAHEYGIASAEVAKCFAILDAGFGQLLQDLRGSDTLVLVTADHGFIDTTPAQSLNLAQYPDLAATLALPLCGERRAAWCYVRPQLAWRFEQCVAEQLADVAWLYRSEDLIAKGWFGRGPAHPKLAERIGDYALIMKDNWTLGDTLPGEKPYHLIGVHGGVSQAEMQVPLIMAEC